MSKNLVQLTKASGNAGTAGESFRNHVSGAGDGAKMTDYIVSGWTWGGEPAPESSYNDGEVFNMSFTFTQGSLAHHIKRTGSAALLISEGSNAAGADVATSHNVVDVASGSTETATVTSAANPNSVVNEASGWFQGYTEPDHPADEDPHTILFSADANTIDEGATHPVGWQTDYTPDIGPFNDTLTRQHAATMIDRDLVTADFEFEWHKNSGYTDLHATTAATVINQSAAFEDITLWLRYRVAGYSSWSNFGAVVFEDPREET